MAISIPDSLPSQPAVLSPASDAAQSSVGDATDTVKLSEDAQIKLLAQQGQTPLEIAETIGVAVIAVDGYLGSTPPPPTPEPESGPSPAASIPAMS
jgi:hypothetical protein